MYQRLSTNESAPYNAAYIQLIPLMDPLDALNTWGVPVEYGGRLTISVLVEP